MFCVREHWYCISILSLNLLLMSCTNSTLSRCTPLSTSTGDRHMSVRVRPLRPLFSLCIYVGSKGAQQLSAVSATYQHHSSTYIIHNTTRRWTSSCEWRMLYSEYRFYSNLQFRQSAEIISSSTFTFA